MFCLPMKKKSKTKLVSEQSERTFPYAPTSLVATPSAGTPRNTPCKANNAPVC